MTSSGASWDVKTYPNLPSFFLVQSSSALGLIFFRDIPSRIGQFVIMYLLKLVISASKYLFLINKLANIVYLGFLLFSIANLKSSNLGMKICDFIKSVKLTSEKSV